MSPEAFLEHLLPDVVRAWKSRKEEAMTERMSDEQFETVIRSAKPNDTAYEALAFSHLEYECRRARAAEAAQARELEALQEKISRMNSAMFDDRFDDWERDKGQERELAALREMEKAAKEVRSTYITSTIGQDWNCPAHVRPLIEALARVEEVRRG